MPKKRRDIDYKQIMKNTKYCYRIDVVLEDGNNFSLRYNKIQGLKSLVLEDVMKPQYTLRS